MLSRKEGRLAFFIRLVIMLAILGGAVRNFVPTAMAADPALVGYWKMDETAGATASDASGSGNNGAVSGAAWTTSGKVGGALECRSGTDHVALANSSSLSFSTNRMTIAGWIYPTDLSGQWSTIIQKSNAGGSWVDWQIYARASDAPTANRPVFRINWDGDTANDANEQVQGDIALTVNTWYFIACTYDGAAMNFYINGTLRGTTARASGTIPNGGKPIWLGANDVWGEPFRGRLDEVQVYNRALSLAEIQTLMNSGSQPTAPAITTQPANQTVTAGQSASFSVTCTGTAPLSYQWQRLSGSTWGAISGATASSYTTPATTATDNGARFRCVATNTQGSATSTEATLTVNPLPTYTLSVSVVGSGSVTKNPDKTQYNSGEIVQLTATAATGWVFNGWSGGLTGSTSPASITMNANKTVTATFSQLTAPTITTQPASQSVAAGQTATFSVTCTGTAPLSYQWQRLSGSTWGNVSGATASSYTTAATTSTDNGARFRCVVTNAQGSSTSNEATLTVTSAPSGLVGYWKMNETAGTTAADTSGSGNNGTVSGAVWTTSGKVSGALECRSGTDHVALANSSSLSFSTNRMTIAGWIYPTDLSGQWCTLIQKSNAGGSWVDWQIYARASDAPTANRPVFRINWDGDTDNDANEEVQGDIALAVNTWYFITCTYDGAAMNFYINGTLRGTTARASGTIPNGGKPIWLGANDVWGEPFRGRLDEMCVYNRALSQAEIQTLMNSGNQPIAPAITTQPAYRTVREGQQATFSVAASGTAPLSYQWQRLSGSTWGNVTGATAAAYTTPITTLADTGARFRCVVTNSQGSATSNEAILTVTSSPTAGFWEDFEAGFTTGQTVGKNADWLDAGSGPVVTAGVGLGGSLGLAPGTDIFTWKAHPFDWNAADFQQLILQMDFQASPSGTFDDDRLGWMTTTANVDSTNCFGVQLDNVTDGGIATYWRDAAGTRIQTPIVPLTGIKANAWYTFRASFTKLTATSAHIDVSLTELDANGNPTGTPITGSLADTSKWTDGAPAASYFSAATMWPAYKNYSALQGAADNAYVEFVTGGSNPTAPTITTQPANQTVQQGRQATFSLTAGGTAPLTYQWQRLNGSTWGNISGATAASYTTPATTLADSGTRFRCVVTNSQGSATSNEAILTVTSSPNTGLREDFESGFTTGQTVGKNAEWLDAGSGPVVTAGIGVGGSIGLAPGTDIFTWKAHPFSWNAADFQQLVLQMDFQASPSGTFDDDRLGWMTTTANVDSTNCFGVQLDTVTDGGIATYWRDSAGTRIQTPIVPLSGIKANAWYRFQAKFTKLTATSAKIDVSLTELDAGGNPTGTPIAGSVADTSQWPDGAPAASYFSAATMWPAYKNFADLQGAADNAYAEFVTAIEKFAFVVVSDLHTMDNQAKVLTNLQQIQTWTANPTAEMPAPKFMVTVGDYPHATLTQSCIESVLGTDFLWFPVMGNHELDAPTTDFNYIRDTLVPQRPWIVSNGPTGSVNSTYSWEYGNAHFVATNSYWNGTTNAGADTATDGDITPALRSWMNSDLTASTKAHKFVFVHEPAYPEVRHQGDALDQYPADRDAFVTMLNSNGVETIFSGHDHYYHHDTAGQYPLLGDMHQVGDGSFVGASDGVGTITYVLVDGAKTTYKVYQSMSGPPFSQIDSWTIDKTPAQYGLTVSASGNGTVTRNPDKAQYSRGEVVQLTAIPAADALFSGWSGDLSGSTNPVTITMNADKTVTATFSPKPVAPVITTQPTDQSVVEGQDATFSLAASGIPQPTYQWMWLNGTAWEEIAGATTASFTMPAVTMSDNGTKFCCMVQNTGGSVTSNEVTLTVSAVPVPPTITLQPADQTILEGLDATFTIAATGSSPLSYQWQRGDGTNWTDVTGATNLAFTISPVQLTDNGVKVRCVVTNPGGTVESNAATLTVTAKPPSNALQFGANNANTYVTFGNNPALGLPQFTVETWFKREGAGATTTTGTGGVTAVPLITKGRGESDGSNVDLNYFLGIQSSNNVLVADFEEGPSTGGTLGLNHPVVGVTPIVNNVWYHAAVTYDGTKWQLFLNGKLETELAVGRPPRADSIQHAGLATAMTSTGAPQGYFVGTLDEVRIWNRARTQDEILAAINSQLTGTQTGLVARWGLNEGTGTNVASSAGTSIPGVIMGSNFQWVTGAPFNILANKAPNPPAVIEPLDLSTDVSISPQLSVAVSDPDVDNMNVTFYGRPVTQVGPDFTIAVLPDTQFYSASSSGGLPAMFTAQTQWIATNRTAENIAFVAHVGDVVNDGDSNLTEWTVASSAMYLLESLVPTLPYGMAVGNHDQTPAGSPTGTTTYYNQYFGSDHFSGQSYYGGHYGTNSDNSYQLFSAGGMDFIVINIEYGASADAQVMSWADGLLKANSTRRGIIVSHDLIGTGNPASFSSFGQTIYNALRSNPNLFLMLCGHTSGEGQRTDTYNGNTVHTLLADYQGRTNGGSGWMRLVKVSPANNQISVRTISPYLSQTETDADSQFTLPVSLQGNAFQRIGGKTGVVSGANAAIQWSGLTPLTEYEWNVKVNDGSTTITSPTWQFITRDIPPSQFTLSLSLSGNGTVSRNPDKDSYTAGETVELTAVPSPGGWAFGGWSGDLSGNANPVTITMNANKTITATFAPPPVPPTITTQPANQSAIVGQTATFTVAASGTPTLRYQWQQLSGSTWTDISGATGASYTTPATALTDNGAQFCCVVTNGQGSATSNPATLTVTSAPVGTLETFNTGFTVGTQIGANASWYSDTNSPVITATNGVGGSVGLAAANSIFTWKAHPFNWNDAKFVSITERLDFQSSTSSTFDDDRIGWMTTISNVTSANIFGVQLDNPDGGIVTYWNTSSGTQVKTPIVALSGIKASTWYRFQVKFTKLTATTAKIEVSLSELDASGNPTGTPITGSVADTSLWSAGAPANTYFTPTAVYPAFKNYSTAPGPADNAYMEITTAP